MRVAPAFFVSTSMRGVNSVGVKYTTAFICIAATSIDLTS